MNKPQIPDFIIKNCENDPEQMDWLKKLPQNIEELIERWNLNVVEMITEGATCSWVAHCKSKSDQSVILKLGMPHMEANSEIDGLVFWDGDPTVRVLEFDLGYNAMLLEKCEPGTPLKRLDESKQDEVIADILKQMWSKKPDENRFRPLDEMIDYWSEGVRSRMSKSPDAKLNQDGLDLFKELLESSKEKFLLATDLHAGNVLQAKRKPWLAIDPKPFVGDPAYDATQHLLNCTKRLESDPIETIKRFSSFLELDWKRVQYWLFARLATGSDPRDIDLAKIVGCE